MTAPEILAIRMARAHETALDVVEEHGPEEAAERVERMRAIGNAANIRNPQELASFQSELMAALAETVEALAARVPKAKKKKAS